MSDEVATSDDQTPATPFPLLLGKAAMVMVWFGVMGLFAIGINREIAIAHCSLSGLLAIILGGMAFRQRNQNEETTWYARRGIQLGCALLLVISAVGLAPLTTRREIPRPGDQYSARQMWYAFGSYEDATNRFPRAVHDPYHLGFPARKGLSWRVGLLPFIEQEATWRKADETRSWDAPQNTELVNTPVRYYTNQFDPNPLMTRSQVFVGPGTMFDPTSATSLSSIPDGTANTVLVSESAAPVPWPAPFDMPYSLNAAPALGIPAARGIVTLMADGSVRYVGKKVSPAVWHSVIQRADGAKVNEDWWKD